MCKNVLSRSHCSWRLRSATSLSATQAPRCTAQHSSHSYFSDGSKCQLRAATHTRPLGAKALQSAQQCAQRQSHHGLQKQCCHSHVCPLCTRGNSQALDVWAKARLTVRQCAFSAAQWAPGSAMPARQQRQGQLPVHAPPPLPAALQAVPRSTCVQRPDAQGRCILSWCMTASRVGLLHVHAPSPLPAVQQAASC